MGQMVVAKGDIRIRPDSVFAAKAGRIEHGGRIHAPIAHAFVLHVFALLDAEKLAQTGFGETSAR